MWIFLKNQKLFNILGIIINIQNLTKLNTFDLSLVLLVICNEIFLILLVPDIQCWFCVKPEETYYMYEKYRNISLSN